MRAVNYSVLNSFKCCVPASHDFCLKEQDFSPGRKLIQTRIESTLTLQFEDYTSSSNYARESFKSTIFCISNSKPVTNGIRLIHIDQQKSTVLRAAL